LRIWQTGGCRKGQESSSAALAKQETHRINLAQPGSRVGGGLGRIGDTIGDSRGSPGIGPGEPFNMQLALKILF
jgi:hypothetical protein